MADVYIETVDAAIEWIVQLLNECCSIDSQIIRVVMRGEERPRFPVAEVDYVRRAFIDSSGIALSEVISKLSVAQTQAELCKAYHLKRGSPTIVQHLRKLIKINRFVLNHFLMINNVDSA